VSLTNPYHSDSTLNQQPANLPRLPFDKPMSDLGKGAARLHTAAQAATERLREVRDAQGDAIAKFTAAKQALQAEIVRGAQEGMDPDREHELSLELAAAERLADPETHALRNRAAVQAQRAAVRAYNVYMWDHYPELLDAELAAEAVGASEALIAALESIRPVSERYQAVRNRVYELSRITHAGPDGQQWAKVLQLDTEPRPPLPSGESLEAFDRARRTELVALEAD
jgi:hypothetical protein